MAGTQELSIISRKELTNDPANPEWLCAACGAPVLTYTSNADLVNERPDAIDSDWWAACGNGECANHHGEGLFQDIPDWAISAKA